MSSSAAARANQRKATVDARDRPALLLAWYDRHRRRLPWRAAPGERADAYRVWLSEIMLQQTTVKAVGPYFEKFLARWPDVAGLGKCLARRCPEDVGRARLLLACAQSSRLCGGGAARPWRRISRYRSRPARAAGNRAVHGGRHCRDCLRPSHHAGRRQHRTGGVAAARDRGGVAAGQAADSTIGGTSRTCSARLAPATVRRR